jgi:hypothetical protein
MNYSNEDECQLADETIAAFFEQFDKDIYTKLVLESLFEELLNDQNLFISSKTRQITS